MRVLSVTGTFTALTVASMIAAAVVRSRISAEPAQPLTTFFTGQPMLMSMIAAPRCSLSFAASAITCGSQPASCIETGSSLGSHIAFCSDCRVSRIIAWLAIISVTVSPAPKRFTARRNGRSVTAVIGARMTGDATSTGPIWMGFTRLMGRREIGEQPLADKASAPRRAAVMTVTALIVAAGKGERLGGGVPKQFRILGGKPVLRWAAEALMGHPAVRAARVVIGRGQEQLAAEALNGLNVGELVQGGAERADSVRAGLDAIDGDAVLVHDAARPFCPPAVVDRLIAQLEFFDGAAPVLGVPDTLARA